MASTYSTNLKIELIGTGDQSGTWGATTNTNLGTLLEQAIVGYSTQAVTDSGVATVLTIPDGASSTGRNYVIALTGTLTAARTVEVPAVNKPYIFFNNTTGGYAVTVKVSGQTGVTIANGKKAIVYTNTTDVIEVANAPVTEAGTQTLTNKTLTSPVIGTVIGGTTASSSLTLQSTSGVGTSDSILFKVGNNGATTAMTVDTSGNVGIGTASPGYKLDIYSATSSTFTLQGDSTVSGLSYRASADTSAPTFTLRKARGSVASPAAVSSGDTSGSLVYSVYGGTNTRNVAAIRASVETYTSDTDISGYLWFQTASAGGTTLTERMRIDSTGNVGIGTASPGYKLDVASASDNVARFSVGNKVIDSTGNVQIFTTNAQSTDVGGSLALGGKNGGAGAFDPWAFGVIKGAKENSTSGNFAGYLAFATSSSGGTISERMRIDSSGNVGIGTTSPGQKLDVVNTANSGVSIRVNSTNAGSSTSGAFILGNDVDSSVFYIQQNSSTNTTLGGGNSVNMFSKAGAMTFSTLSTERMRIDSSGNVGIGNTPAGKLDVGSTSSSFTDSIIRSSTTGISELRFADTRINSGYVAYDNSSDSMRFGTDATERMRIDASGNVGIGTSSNLDKLTVAGGIKSTANINTAAITANSTFVDNFGGARILSYGPNTTTNGTILFYQGKSDNSSGQTAMFIDSSGNVGIGTASLSYKFQVQDNGNINGTSAISNSTAGTSSLARFLAISDAGSAAFGFTSSTYTDITGAQDALLLNANNASGGMAFALDGVLKMKMDSSGNVGIGVTPSAWSSYRGLQVGNASVADTIGGNNALFGSNVYYNGTAFTYIGSTSATLYRQLSGTHTWSYAASGTAGNSISFTQAMTLDSSGNLGIGTSSPGQKLTVGSLGVLRLQTGSVTMDCTPTAGATDSFVWNTSANCIYSWSMAGSERMRIDSSGNLLVGQSSWSWSNNGTEILSTGRMWSVSNTDYNLELAGSQTARVRFYTSAGGNGTTVGSISVTTSATAYNTSSDYRLKHSVASMVSGLSTVSALKPVTYKWNVDDSDGEGFIAHELQEVIPHAVTGEKDAVDAEGNIIPQGVDYSKIVVHLVAAIQELSAKNDALEARLATLEGK